jgi:hypothetical protein
MSKHPRNYRHRLTFGYCRQCHAPWGEYRQIFSLLSSDRNGRNFCARCWDEVYPLIVCMQAVMDERRHLDTILKQSEPSDCD